MTYVPEHYVSHVAAYYFHKGYHKAFCQYMNMCFGYIAYPINNAKVI